nr:hypothetical protein [Burkholderia lata]
MALSMEVRLECLVIAGALTKLGCSILGVNWSLNDEEACFLLNPSLPQCESRHMLARASSASSALRRGKDWPTIPWRKRIASRSVPERSSRRCGDRSRSPMADEKED